jgi:NTP pyrophosphatase (non-canonical NTP hydrolase)
MRDLNLLSERVVRWADNKGILKKATPIAQMEKTEEEVFELKEAIYAKENGNDVFWNEKGFMVNTDEEIKDAIGDITVTLIIQAELQNLSFAECLEAALEVIEKRTGKMIDGKFVKDK